MRKVINNFKKNCPRKKKKKKVIFYPPFSPPLITLEIKGTQNLQKESKAH